MILNIFVLDAPQAISAKKQEFFNCQLLPFDEPEHYTGSRYYYWTNHWVESYEDGYGPCAGGDYICSRDLDGVSPDIGGNGSGGFCSHDPDGSAHSNKGLGSLHRNLYDHDISNPFAFYLAGDYELKIR